MKIFISNQYPAMFNNNTKNILSDLFFSNTHIIYPEKKKNLVNTIIHIFPKRIDRR